jgi:asparagine synthase (glutamine-hydrolysing)
MSGIAGVIHMDGRPADLHVAQAMTAAMHYRGPDGVAHWSGGPAAMGHCMLATTAESLGEKLPLVNEDGSLVLTIDGRVDNRAELRRALLDAGLPLRSDGDSELVLRAYERWGPSCLSRIDGDFALVIWDARQRQAFCARDRLGTKPFHYHWNGSTLVFASEVHAVFAAGVQAQVNEGLLAEVLAWDLFTNDETLWQGISRLPPGHSIVFTPQGKKQERYWAPDLHAELNYRDERQYFEHYRELLTNSVRANSRSHARVACEVSGGLDSSGIFCVAEGLRRAGDLPAPGLDGYTLEFREEGDANELMFARAVGLHLGLPIHEVVPTSMPPAWYAERARQQRDLVAFPNGVMALGLMETAYSQGSRVLLSGAGGDEWLGGSRLYYAEELSRLRVREFATCLSADAAAYGWGTALGWAARFGFVPLLPSGLKYAARGLRRALGKRPTSDFFWLSDRLESMRKARVGPFLARSRQFEERVPRPGQAEYHRLLNSAYRQLSGEMMERLTARCGLERRHPLNHPALVEFAFSVPERMRQRGAVGKYLHRQALRDLLPPVVYSRQSKAEFSIVFRDHLDMMRNKLCLELPARRGAWFKAQGMQRLWAAYADASGRGWPLWRMWTAFECDNLMP